MDLKNKSKVSAEKLEEFINEYLKVDLRELEHHLNLRNEEAQEFIQLKNMIENIREHFDGNFKTQMNIGGNMFIKAKVYETEKILVNIGKDIYLELSLEEAIKFAEFKIRVLNKEIEVIRNESIKKRADIKLATICLGDKQNLNYDKS